ncbi:HAD-IA family hydrolase [Acidicapsa dinghuensis]|uniref:HAD-IA family hydrolase n=1 Tax=Acidicapsa dinghuensis TaxID=2218256 RepID=A0ABW1EDU3_9BACT|nr:HAD-IA family hydrolase [Acidicapsa dinghuensis]
MSSSPGSNGRSFDAILFDVGGVMLTNGWDHNERKLLLDQFNLDREAFESRHEKPNDAWERDLLTIGGYLKETLFYEPRSFTETDFIEAMKAVSVPIPTTAIPVVRDLAESGKYLVGTLNNESRYLHEYRMRKYGIDQYLDVQFCSAFLGMRKPDADIYRRALDILSLPGDRVVFIDDRANNAAAAAAAGMHAIRFQGEDNLREDLHLLDIL